MENSNLKDGTEVPQSTESEVPTSAAIAANLM